MVGIGCELGRNRFLPLSIILNLTVLSRKPRNGVI
jgi:hypothetical protein